MRERDLANPSIIGLNLSVAPRDESEIDYVDEICLKNLEEMIDHEIGTVGAQRFVVYRQVHFVV